MTWTTLLKPMRAWWHQAPGPERPAVTFRIAGSTPRVPAEYLPLYAYLEHRYASVVVLTFEEMEALLGFALPESACREPDWWTGTPVDVPRHSAAWMEAGRGAAPNLSARNVTFERTAPTLAR